MKNRGWVLILAAALVAALLAGCSTAAPQLQEGVVPTAAPAAEPDTKDSTGANQNGSLPLIDPGDAAKAGKKIIYNAEIVIEAESAEKAANSIVDKAVEFDGYLADSYIMTDNRNAESYITVRIPPEKLKEFTAFIGTLGKGVSSKVDSSDVTDQYYDVQARLSNAQAQETQLLKIMEQAVKIDDILSVRKELNAVQQEIEQLKGQIRLMDNQVGYATVKVSIRQPAPPAVVVEDQPDKGVQFWGFDAIWQKISRGFSDGFNWTLNAISGLLIGLSYVIIPMFLIAVFVFAVILIVKLSGRKNRKKALPPAAPAPQHPSQASQQAQPPAPPQPPQQPK